MNLENQPSSVDTLANTSQSVDAQIEHELLQQRITFADRASGIFIRVSVILLLVVFATWLMAPQYMQFLALTLLASPILMCLRCCINVFAEADSYREYRVSCVILLGYRYQPLFALMTTALYFSF